MTDFGEATALLQAIGSILSGLAATGLCIAAFKGLRSWRKQKLLDGYEACMGAVNLLSSQMAECQNALLASLVMGDIERHDSGGIRRESIKSFRRDLEPRGASVVAALEKLEEIVGRLDLYNDDIKKRSCGLRPGVFQMKTATIVLGAWSRLESDPRESRRLGIANLESNEWQSFQNQLSDFREFVKSHSPT